MKRFALLVLLLGAILTPTLRTDRSALTNEGHPVIIVNPTNGLPPGWTWAD